VSAVNYQVMVSATG